jgi:hypothetical protein
VNTVKNTRGDSGPKGQHTVPESYLKAWGDPTAKNPLDPYVWSFPKDKIKGAPKPPAAIFKRADFYTIHLPDGSRDLRLEHGLASTEERFCAIRDEKLANGRALSPEERVWVCAFVAAMKARTPGFMEFHREQYRPMLEYMRELEAWAATATPEQRAAQAGIWALRSDKRPSGTIEDVERIVASPVEHLMPPMIAAQLPILAEMNMTILTTDDPVGFITSDEPCVLFDPNAYKRPPIYRSPGLAFETIEVTLPASPTQLVLLSWRGPEGYREAPLAAVENLNRLRRFHAHEYYVVNANVSRPIWFHPGVEPKDSWEKTEGPKWGAKNE